VNEQREGQRTDETAAHHLTTIRRNIVSSISAFPQEIFQTKRMHDSSLIGGF
jgi:hypothetical protein